MSASVIKSTLGVLSFLLITAANGQFELQSFSANMAGGNTAGDTFSSEVALGEIGGLIPVGSSLSFYLGMPANILESGVVSSSLLDGSGAVIDPSSTGYLILESENPNYDTLAETSADNGNLVFNPVFAGNYLLAAESDPSLFIPTYFGDAFEWENAEILSVTGDISVEINIEEVPPERNESTGSGVVSGTIEEDFGDDNARVDARRRAARRKCGLKRRTRSGRPAQEQDEFELIAYGETNENGEFEYGFLPVGTYRFFVEYPGIPLDETSFVEFDVGEAGVTDDSFVLAVFVSEDGIEIDLILGITSQFFTDFKIYPNPTTDLINISYDKILSPEVKMEIINMEGKSMYQRELQKGRDKDISLDISIYPPGQYLIQFTDGQKSKDNQLIFRLIKK
ncbi:MAG: hypothetical protein Tsb0034_27030 [Ekhidna sp.]